MEQPANTPKCTYVGLKTADDCPCPNCNQRRALNASAKEPVSMKEHIKSIHDEHEEQFNIAVNAAFKRGFSRWFEDTWFAARSAGALPNPFISSMFVFITTILTKKFVAGLPATLSVADKEQAIMQASGFLKGYLDQIEAAAIKELHMPKPSPSEESPLTSGGKPAPKPQFIIPEKKVIRH